jgi:hypothetical protein
MRIQLFLVCSPIALFSFGIELAEAHAQLLANKNGGYKCLSAGLLMAFI